MKNKLLCVNLPCYSTIQDFVENDYQYNPALGLLALTEYATMFGFESYVKDFNYNEVNYDELFEFIESKGITVIGFTSYTENLNIMFKFMRMIKSYNRDIVLVVGGPHATLRPDEVIKNRNVDYVIPNDGESTLLELLVYLEKGEEIISPNNITGLIYKEDGKKIMNESRNGVTDLNLLPVINRTRVEIDRYRSIVSVYTSKGCPAKCIYCSASAISGAKYRMRDIRNVFLECQVIYNQVNSDTDKLYFIDDTFTVNKQRVNEFCDLHTSYEHKMAWSCESRVDVMTKELVDKIGNSNCFSIQFGVESGNQEVLDNINKDIQLEHLKKIVKHIGKYKIGVFLSLMLGHYSDTEETMQQTMDLVEEMVDVNPNVEYGISINTPFPGTYQYEHAEELGIEIMDQNYSHYNLVTPVIRTKNFNEELLHEMYVKANSMKGAK
ncbi:radical SAM protein [Alkalibaculum bacchi]|uniref:B12-binding domain-containing radical SAM protein n=1 Tax=Alkalibaculum bacchi TaxID=645887 RepID=UPI0026F29ED9|nr:radical SAM protein [Alkalibaculum bacchi]